VFLLDDDNTGTLVEDGPTLDVFQSPKDPRTEASSTPSSPAASSASGNALARGGGATGGAVGRVVTAGTTRVAGAGRAGLVSPICGRAAGLGCADSSAGGLSPPASVIGPSWV
jgi:hypothetical protein